MTMRGQFIRASIALVAMGLSFVPPAARAESVDTLLRKGNKHYADGSAKQDQQQIKAAVDTYKEALKRDPSPLIKYNLGTAQAKLGQYKDAQQTLSEATETQSATQRRDSYFNLGIAQGKPVIEKARTGGARIQAQPDQMKNQIASLENSLKSFRQAIAEAPDDTEAIYNYEVVKRNLKQLQQQQARQQQQNEGQKNDRQGQSQGQSQGQQQQGQGQQGGQSQQQNQQNQQGQQGQQNQQQQNQQNQNQQGQQGQQNQQQQNQQNQNQQGQQDQNQQDQKQPQSQQTNSNDLGDRQGQAGQQNKGGLEGQKRQDQPRPQGSSMAKASSQDGEEEIETEGDSGKKQQLTPEQMDAVRVLNLLEKDKPEQYKRLFQFRDGERKLKKDW